MTPPTLCETAGSGACAAYVLPIIPDLSPRDMVRLGGALTHSLMPTCRIYERPSMNEPICLQHAAMYQGD